MLECLDNKDDDIPPDILEMAVRDTVKKQIDVGVTIVGDGEMSKPSYVSYVTKRLEGFGGSDRGPGVADLADYPGFAKQQINIGAVIPRDSEYIKCCTGPIKYKDFDAVNQDLKTFQTVLNDEKPRDGSFVTAASPGVVALFQV